MVAKGNDVTRPILRSDFLSVPLPRQYYFNNKQNKGDEGHILGVGRNRVSSRK